MPEFTNEEMYVISSAKCPGRGNSYMWCYLIGSIVIAGIAAYHQSVVGMSCAFLVLCGFRVYEDWLQCKSSDAFRSAIEKYEQALEIGNDSESTE